MALGDGRVRLLAAAALSFSEVAGVVGHKRIVFLGIPIAYRPSNSSKPDGIEPFPTDMAMVLCNQIGAQPPPAEPLVYVATRIARVHTARATATSGGFCRPRFCC